MNYADTDVWRPMAACRAEPTGLFFPDTEAQAGPAKAVCEGCPVRAECLDFAMATRQEDGVWGGLTGMERRRLRKKPKAKPAPPRTRTQRCVWCRESFGAVGPNERYCGDVCRREGANESKRRWHDRQQTA